MALAGRKGHLEVGGQDGRGLQSLEAEMGSPSQGVVMPRAVS